MPNKAAKAANSKKQVPSSAATATGGTATTVSDEPLPAKSSKEDKMQAAMNKFAEELSRDSDEEGDPNY
uniref:Similar to n=1 Tax=Syphacia muris TaxID=451379 RepID=A0A0N5AJQ0_9BILA